MKIKADAIRLFLLPEVEERIRHYTALAQGEISGLGIIEEDDRGFLVTDLFLPAQSCSNAGTEIDQEAIATLLLELDRSGRDPGALRFWWHSHGTMDTFWSGTDEQCIQNLANGDYVLSLVTNKRGHLLARLDIFQPVRLAVDDIEVAVRARSDGLLDQCRQEVKTRVHEQILTPYLLSGARRSLHVPEPDLDEVWAWGSELSELEELFYGGEITWMEYQERLQELGVANG
jgi:hypothetical protein